VPLFFLLIGLTSLTSVALSFYGHRPPPWVSPSGGVPRLLSGALCGLGIAIFIWWVFIEMKKRLKRRT
jgi:hypothetical protein